MDKRPSTICVRPTGLFCFIKIKQRFLFILSYTYSANTSAFQNLCPWSRSITFVKRGSKNWSSSNETRDCVKFPRNQWRAVFMIPGAWWPCSRHEDHALYVVKLVSGRAVGWLDGRHEQPWGVGTKIATCFMTNIQYVTGAWWPCSPKKTFHGRKNRLSYAQIVQHYQIDAEVHHDLRL